MISQKLKHYFVNTLGVFAMSLRFIPLVVFLCLCGCDYSSSTYKLKAKVEKFHIKKGMLGGETGMATLSFSINDYKFLQDVELTPSQFEYCTKNEEVDIQVVFQNNGSNNTTSISIMLMGTKVYDFHTNESSQKKYLRSFIKRDPIEELTAEEKEKRKNENIVVMKRFAWLVGSIFVVVCLLRVFVFKVRVNCGHYYDYQTRYEMYCERKNKEKEEKVIEEFNALEAKEMVSLIDSGKFKTGQIKSEFKREFVEKFLKEKYSSLESLGN